MEDKAKSKPLNGVCCACKFSGEEETECPVRDDGIHCEHWWEGPDGDKPQESVE